MLYLLLYKHRAQPLSEKPRHPGTRWNYDAYIIFWILKYRILFLNNLFLLTSFSLTYLTIFLVFLIFVPQENGLHTFTLDLSSVMFCSTTDALNMRYFCSASLWLFHKGLGEQMLPQSMKSQPNLLGD